MQFLNWAAECHHVMDGGPAYHAGPGRKCFVPLVTGRSGVRFGKLRRGVAFEPR